MSSIFNQIKYPFPVKFLKVKDYQIAYIDEGNSTNVLTFHSWSWKLFKSLGKEYS